MEGVFAFHAFEAIERLVDGRETDETGARGEVGAPPGVLHERRSPRRQVARRPVAEPTRAPSDIRVFGDPELGLLQPQPLIIGRRTPFGRALQFSAALFSPIFSRA